MVVQGDLLADNVGLSVQDQNYIFQNCNIIINCAASIDFNAKLEEAIQSNIQGTLRIFEVAKKCQKLENFMHVSTCYVNSNMDGFIEEKIYNNSSSDPMVDYKNLIQLSPQELEIQTKSILGNYANTYVFTKALVERILEQYKPPNMTITILRPSIIGASVQQPQYGWVEGVTALSATFLLCGIGMIRYLEADEKSIADIVPVDCVSDQIIVSSALYAVNQSVNVMNCGTSFKNPVEWKLTHKQCSLYWKNNPSKKQMVYKSENISDMFKPFVVRQFIFDTSKIDNLAKQLQKEELDMFYLDVSRINWEQYLLMYNWGIQRFILNEHIDPPFSNKNNILNINSYTINSLSYFSDVNWALTSGKNFKTKSFQEYRLLLINSISVQNAIQQTIQQKSQQQQVKKYSIINQVNKEVENIIKQMVSNYQMSYVRMMGWLLKKLFQQIYEKIVIDDKQLLLLQNYNTIKNGPLIMMPTHRSYLDFLLVSYIFFAYKLQAPHIAASEDFLNVQIVHHILRANGAFFMKRNSKNNIIYKAIFNEYIKLLLQENCMLEFFIEGTRSRSGKMLQPKHGIMRILCDAVFDQRIPDAKVVPITLNYEKVLEGDTFPYELLGEEKIKESLPRLIKALKTLNQNYGKIFIHICEPISILAYQQNKFPSLNLQSQDQRKQVVQSLSYQVQYKQTAQLVCTSTSIVASIILSCRKGITEDALITQVQWLCQRIIERGGNITNSNDMMGYSQVVKTALNLLKGILIKSKKNIFQVELTSDTEYKNVLMLHYYRNGIIHIFILEAIVCLVLSAFGSHIAFQEGISAKRLWEEVQFLINLFDKEFVVQNIPRNQEEFKNVLLQKMVQFNVISIENNDIVKALDENQIGFYCTFVMPIIESYWSVMIYMYTLLNQKQKQQVKKIYQGGQMVNGCSLQFDTALGINCRQIQNQLQVVGDGQVIFSTGNIIVIKDLQTKKYQFIQKENRFKNITCMNAQLLKNKSIIIAVGESSMNDDKPAMIVVTYQTDKKTFWHVLNQGFKGVVKQVCINTDKYYACGLLLP
ncbi:hypothetical protein IMG5_141120 [Ichthyophthirius multifiliis]|uniref:Phospholipid/glycerol acyltransferase domain-containing protein n=1 Tax=Ichthyophthirius multifiliis TaxID=5932 RepID=G0QXC8_ICHMU|nr:hypothetical protein IMG5_141120 [Ichthyophthirius multifiliis]EGR30131.1 hypothetical protein IMG5_141120 [Ichthyophthirius multifiliis]|eukprot:XP_004031367.1 hypothetical protein IMG5_141120 [Ichthyophthirius multifiliis]